MDEEAQAQPDGESQDVIEESSASENAALDGEAQIEEPTAESEEDEAEKPKPKRGFQKRISGLTERLQKQQERIDQLEAEKSQPKADAPNRDDYDDYEEFLEAKAAYVAEQKFADLQSKADAEQSERARRQEAQQLEARWDDSLEKARDKYDDFDDVAFGDVHITDQMSLAIKDSDNSGEVAYYLGKNPKEAESIARKHPLAQYKAIGAIEERLKERPTRPTPPKPVTRGRTSQTTANTELSDDMPIDQWLKVRNKQLGRS